MEALSFWLISIVQDEVKGWQGLIIKPIILYLGLKKKVEFLEELSLWGGHAIKSFTASDAVI